MPSVPTKLASWQLSVSSEQTVRKLASLQARCLSRVLYAWGAVRRVQANTSMVHQYHQLSLCVSSLYYITAYLSGVNPARLRWSGRWPALGGHTGTATSVEVRWCPAAASSRRHGKPGRYDAAWRHGMWWQWRRRGVFPGWYPGWPCPGQVGGSLQCPTLHGQLPPRVTALLAGVDVTWPAGMPW